MGMEKIKGHDTDNEVRQNINNQKEKPFNRLIITIHQVGFNEFSTCKLDSHGNLFSIRFLIQLLPLIPPCPSHHFSRHTSKIDLDHCKRSRLHLPPEWKQLGLRFNFSFFFGVLWVFCVGVEGFVGWVGVGWGGAQGSGSSNFMWVTGQAGKRENLQSSLELWNICFLLYSFFSSESWFKVSKRVKAKIK